MGQRLLDFDTIAVGDEGPPLVHTLTRPDLVVYAGASGDFNPMHTDEIAAQQAGLPSVFGHGMFSAGLLATAITNFVGIGNLTGYKVRFTRQTWPGEALTTRVTVVAKDDATRTVTLDCSLTNQDGETKISGSATTRLP
jgi:acyl dehydratase